MEIVFSSTTDLAEAIRSRRVSATEVLDAHLAHIAKHNPVVNAVATLDVARAQEQARDVDEALARGEIRGALHGVPFTLKDAHATAGLRTTSGFPPLADFAPAKDGAVAARLKAAGAILLGKTNVPVMLGDYQCSNPLFGRTNNPWNVARTSGGSSGGGAAAIAAGMTPFDIGTDLASSIRIPAHFCGVFGLKPTEKRVPLTGLVPNPWNSPRGVRIMTSIGPMARTVDDLALLFSIIAGPDGEDTEVQPVPLERVPDAELKCLRIAFAPTLPGVPVMGEIRDAIVKLAKQLDPLCALIKEATLPELDFNEECLRAGELIDMQIGTFQSPPREPPTTLAQYLEALHRRDRSIFAWEEFFAAWDVLLCPAAMTVAFPHCKPGTPLHFDGDTVDYRALSAHGVPFNYSGHPAIVLPYALDGEGLPIGVQIVTKRWNEMQLLAIAKALSRVTGEFRRPPGY